MAAKRLRFNPTVEVYEEHFVASASTGDCKYLRFNPSVDEYEACPIASVPTGCCNGAVSQHVLDPVLRPGTPLRLDFSLPSALFCQPSRLPPALLHTPASTPPVPRVTIRIPNMPDSETSPGLCQFYVLHSPEGEAVTVGDVLSAIHRSLREPLPSSDLAVLRHQTRRVKTVAGHGTSLDPRTKASVERDEEMGGARRVDQLNGYVVFAGIERPAGKDPLVWHVKLELCSRYDRV
ncbi:hypothetical protein B0H15DRAFT_912546 [Mycena belliarum]|uniref:DUF6699 domain-containing protein n=1 Tax=Mycena belliarum TaxID=1033014 RepID=A0AAD6TWQ4_9AGAR|nr:hypothetical protein B0H15DRAFT_912546 [Mycena belliae]